MSAWPDGTRLIVRREKLHQGAQRSLFPSMLYQYCGHHTDAAGDPVDLDWDVRQHARVEDDIKTFKEFGLQRFQFSDLGANRAWLHTVCCAADLLGWFQALCCNSALARAEPKQMRWVLRHTPARIVRHSGHDIVRIINGWPTNGDLLGAYQRIAAIT